MSCRHCRPRRRRSSRPGAASYVGVLHPSPVPVPEGIRENADPARAAQTTRSSPVGSGKLARPADRARLLSLRIVPPNRFYSLRVTSDGSGGYDWYVRPSFRACIQLRHRIQSRRQRSHPPRALTDARGHSRTLIQSRAASPTRPMQPRWPQSGKRVGRRKIDRKGGIVVLGRLLDFELGERKPELPLFCVNCDYCARRDDMVFRAQVMSLRDDYVTLARRVACPRHRASWPIDRIDLESFDAVATVDQPCPEGPYRICHRSSVRRAQGVFANTGAGEMGLARDPGKLPMRHRLW